MPQASIAAIFRQSAGYFIEINLLVFEFIERERSFLSDIFSNNINQPKPINLLNEDKKLETENWNLMH